MTELTKYEPSPAAMLEKLIEKGADLSVIEKFMDLADRQEKANARRAYHKAMAAFKLNPPDIEKDQPVDFSTSKGRTSYSHASLANVSGKINKALSEHGLSVGWTTTQDGANITVTCTITHELGHSESTSLSHPPDETGNKNSIQAIGSTISYLERYTILALTGLATRDMDDDGNAAGDPRNFCITLDQETEIRDIINGKGVDEAAFLKYMKSASIAEIRASDYDKAMAALKKAKGRKREPGQEG